MHSAITFFSASSGRSPACGVGSSGVPCPSHSIATQQPPAAPARAESLHVLRVFFNASLKNLGNVLFKIEVCPLFQVHFSARSVPARAESLHTNVRFSLHVLRVFFNASLKNSGNVLFKIEVCPLFQPLFCKVCPCTC